jgi:RNA polymerase sigma factor (TIGR02999 family)
LVYDELQKLATQKMVQEAPGQTLQATALVHEAYLRLVGVEKAQSWDGRGHFFAAAAESMRRILIENARRKRRLRHGGEHKRLTLDQLDVSVDGDSEDLIALDEALTKLAEQEPTIGQVVQLRYFAGLTIEQAAATLGISVRTANRHWSYAKAWLFQEMGCER